MLFEMLEKPVQIIFEQTTQGIMHPALAHKMSFPQQGIGCFPQIFHGVWLF
jgi:hypothetical protein